MTRIEQIAARLAEIKVQMISLEAMLDRTADGKTEEEVWDMLGDPNLNSGLNLQLSTLDDEIEDLLLELVELHYENITF